jgi:hypothetical protein
MPPGKKGGGRGRAGFVPTLPPKPAKFEEAKEELRSLLEGKEAKAHVGWGFCLDSDDKGPAVKDNSVRAKDPDAPPPPKRSGAWTLFVYTDDPAVNVPATFRGFPVARRGVPKAQLPKLGKR